MHALEPDKSTSKSFVSVLHNREMDIVEMIDKAIEQGEEEAEEDVVVMKDQAVQLC